MGIFNGLMGNASEINLDALIKEYNKILAENERIEKAYKLVRDLFIFTNKRLILVDKQGVTGKKTEYHSIPYKSITHFSIETAGHFDLEAELKIWISGNALPIEKQFNSSLNIYELQQVLATYCLR
ncbi:MULTISPECIES: PH domain-containing protein [unclassified Clostridium]|uniref:PH domain-containing protein n=1 Tax=unclassified Clostridium TaxID=2614128 RepID=UPI0025E43A6C|nr:PH domain-containing protein [Clostridium sp.]MDY2629919.1 PH domain-containing protein [Clostridium sp.]MDY4253272.1 PH domain-containing protein [Clostridium sp.]MDY6228235.1 PH domain-containing protein [Clostridium sp.]